MTVWGTLGRLLLVPIAFLIAAAAACAVLVTLGLERITQSLASENIDTTNIAEVISALQSGAALISALSIIPALLVVIVGEVARIRSALFYTIGGGAALATAPLVAGMVDGGSVSAPVSIVWQVMATAGFCGGFVYWIIAGRTA